MIESKQDLNKGKLVKGLTELGMRDLLKESTGQEVTETHFRGKNQVDRIWSTKDIDFHAKIFIPLWSGMEYRGVCVTYIP